MSLDLKTYYQEPLLNFLFCFVLFNYAEEPIVFVFVSVFFFPFFLMVLYAFSDLLHIKQGLFGQMVVLTLSCNSYANSVQNYICAICTVFYTPFGNGFKCRNKQDLKICHFSYPSGCTKYTSARC